MTVDATSPVPLYHQIALLLRSRIHEGDYAAGALMPTEHALRTEFAVSRATIRHAMSELVDGGIVSRRRGWGTVVLPGATHLTESRFRGSLANLMTGKGARVESIEIERHVAPAARTARRLAVEDGLVTVVRRRWHFDGLPIAFKLNYVKEPFGRSITRALLAHEPHVMRLIEADGVKIMSAEQSIRARAADREVGRELRVVIGAPVLFVERLVHGEVEPVELAQTWYRGDRYEYSVDFDLSDGQGAVASLA